MSPKVEHRKPYSLNEFYNVDVHNRHSNGRAVLYPSCHVAKVLCLREKDGTKVVQDWRFDKNDLTTTSTQVGRFR